MKKQYIFVIMIIITLYILYLIGTFKYKEYKINSNIDYITNLNKEISKKIENANQLIDYKKSNAYKNKILKEEQGFKNKNEKVIYLTNEDRYNKFTKDIEEYKQEVNDVVEEENNANTDTKEMSTYEKWIYFLFKKNSDL
ncbi:MAG: hypothetical protein PHH98_05530 [Candidatus Gracilibacteria bacterium]|nr:hypothetical protein [Candidatus Gracilibacteria bacterium]